MGLATNGDEYKYEEGEIPPSPNNLGIMQLELKMKVEVEEKGYDDRKLAALQLKLEMHVGVEDKVGPKNCGFDLKGEHHQ